MTKQEIINLINESELDQAIEGLKAALPGNNDVVLQSSRWRGLTKDINNGLLGPEYARMERNRIVQALLSLVEKIKEAPAGGGGNSAGSTPKVFISYNHKDAETANRVKAFLESKNIHVTIDAEAMKAGEDIQAFIYKCIRETDVTLSLVSTNSLLSAWVGMETLNTLAGENIANKKFIACTIQAEFFEMSFVRTSIEKIDARLTAIKDEMKYRIDNELGIEDLQNERSRNQTLKNDLPKIVANLKNRLNVDISNENFNPGMDRIVKAILA